MAICTAFLVSVTKIWFKPFETTLVNAIFPKLSYKNTMVDGVESFFQIDENHTIYKVIVDIDRPTISSFNQCSECTVQWSPENQVNGDSTKTKKLKLQYKVTAKFSLRRIQFVSPTVQCTMQNFFPSLLPCLCTIIFFSHPPWFLTGAIWQSTDFFFLISSHSLLIRRILQLNSYGFQDLNFQENFKTSPTKQDLVDFFYGFFSKFTPHRRIIGETKRRLNDRLNDHRRSVDKTNIKSKPTTVAEHFLSHPNHCHPDMQRIPLELIHSSRDSIRKARESFLIAELRRPEGPPSGAPYSSRKEKETHELIFSWLSWLAHGAEWPDIINIHTALSTH